MKSSDLKIKIFSDGADVSEMENAAKTGIIKGFTTNPTLMKKSGIIDYKKFANEALGRVNGLPISFEVFSDDFDKMESEAEEISSWGNNVYVKIPITNTSGETSNLLIKKLVDKGIKLNITAILTVEQVNSLLPVIQKDTHIIISVFAGRIADTGRDPIPYMIDCKNLLLDYPNAELLWASSRELLNIVQAQECGCKIITVTNDLLNKLSMLDKDLTELSLDTVKMFYNDASSAGYKII